MDKKFGTGTTLGDDRLYNAGWLFGHKMLINSRDGSIFTHNKKLDIDKYLTACVIYSIEPHDIIKEDINE